MILQKKLEKIKRIKGKGRRRKRGREKEGRKEDKHSLVYLPTVFCPPHISFCPGL